MVVIGVIGSWSGEVEETSMGLCTIESIGLWTTVQGIEFTLEPKWVSCNLARLLSLQEFDKALLDFAF